MQLRRRFLCSMCGQECLLLDLLLSIRVLWPLANSLGSSVTKQHQHYYKPQRYPQCTALTSTAMNGRVGSSNIL